MKKIFIGGAWPYANNSLHIGHLAALLPGDVIARFYRKNGNEVIFVSGTDSHGTPITTRAKNEKTSPEELVNKYHNEFVKVFNELDFSYDVYTATKNKYHKDMIQKFFLKMNENGYLYEKEDDEDFCPTCNEFLSDRELEGICPHCNSLTKGEQCDNCLLTVSSNELKDRRCRTCGSKTILKKNNHLFFALSKLQNQIAEYVNKKEENWRANSVSETKKYLKMGLIDRAATRQLNWGVDIPIPGFSDKKVYVWIEAVLGYLTAGYLACENRGLNFSDFIKEGADSLTYYTHGKDNIVFHSIIFPALLLSLNENYKLPDYIVSSNYMNFNNEKISKSKGNYFTLPDLLSAFDSDTLRFYICFNGPETKDSNFSIELLTLNHNKHLVGEYGNFINRNFSFLNKKFDGIIPLGMLDPLVEKEIQKCYLDAGEFFKKGEIRNATNSIIELIKFSNKYYDESKPWIQVKESLEDFNNTTFNCATLIANIANLFEPIIPKSSKVVFEMMNIKDNSWKMIYLEKTIQLEKVDVLFNRIEMD